ncbi:hypothetical protein AMTR_s01342p00005150, partial [Amborella trichopoda]
MGGRISATRGDQIPLWFEKDSSPEKERMGDRISATRGDHIPLWFEDRMGDWILMSPR